MQRHRLIDRRKKLGLSQEALAKALDLERTTIGRWERGEATPYDSQRPGLAEALHVTLDDLPELLGERPANERGMPQWFSAYLGMEQSATSIQAHQTRVVHGLLQTPDYARVLAGAVLVTPTEAQIAQTVSLRKQRQERLQRRGDRLNLTAVHFEAALRLKVGSAETMADQLDHLVEVSALPNVSVQVIPYDAGMYEGIRGPFSLLTMPWQEIPSVNTEGYGTSRFAEEPHEVEYFLAVWKQLSKLALPPEESIGFIADRAVEWKNQI